MSADTMQTSLVDQRLLHLLDKVDDSLWSSYQISATKTEVPPVVHMIFPRHGRRISEQELRGAMIAQVCAGTDFLFSMETPTRKTYQWSGKKAVKARSDLTIYDRTARHAIANVELKSDMVSAERKKKGTITKDIEKLLREDCDGLFYFVIKDVNRRSLRKLWAVICDALDKKAKKFASEIREKRIVFRVNILKKSMSFQYVFFVTGSTAFMDHPVVSYGIHAGKITVQNLWGWTQQIRVE